MLTRPECLLCIIDDLSGALEAEVPDESVRFRILRDALRFLSEGFSPDRTPSYYITEVHRILKRMAEIPVPFAARRDAANRVGMEIARRVEARAAEMDGWERFRLLAAWAIAGNEMDFRTVGTGYAFAEQDLERMYAESLSKLKVDDLREIYARLDTVRCVLCIHDNVGEIALDRALLSDLRRRGIYTISAVRSGPITSDATMDDAQFVGLHDAVDEVILAGPDTLGISFEEMSDALRDALQSADLVISKGQANFYAFSEHRDEIPGDLVYLLRTKCDAVSSVFGGRGKISVAALSLADVRRETEDGRTMATATFRR